MIKIQKFIYTKQDVLTIIISHAIRSEANLPEGYCWDASFSRSGVIVEAVEKKPGSNSCQTNPVDA
jgi:hypothetical protein